MAITFATISYDLSDYGGIDFDSRRTKVYATNNIDDNTVIDTDGNRILLGSTTGTVNADGTGTIAVPIPSAGTNPASWQTYIHVDYHDRSSRGRDTRTFGPYPVTASINLADLVAQIPAPPEMPYALSISAADVRYAPISLDGEVDGLQTQINAWTPSGIFRGTWSAAIAYAQGNQVVHVDTTYAANAATTAGETPGVSAKWTIIPSIESQTARIANISRIAGAVTGAWYTNLALIPVPHPSPAPSTGWGHSGSSAGTNSRLATTGPDPVTAPAVYRRTFSDIPTTAQGISYVVTGLTAGKFYSFRMANRTSWNSRRLMQVTYRNASNVEIGTTHATAYSDVIPVGSGGTWHSIGFTPPTAAPAGAVEAVIRCMAEIGGASQSLSVTGNTVDGSAVTVVEGPVAAPFFAGDSTLGWWLGTKGISQSRGFVPTIQVTDRPKVINIAPDGADYTTIQAAVDAANDGDTLLIYPGQYRESISAFGKHDLHLRGMSRDKCVIIDSTGAYSTPCLEIGSGSVRSLTLISDHATAGTNSAVFEDQRGYTIHADSEAAMTGRSLIVEDCTMRNSRRAAIGSGLWQDCTITVRRCDIWSGTPTLANDRNRGAIYFHNRTTNTGITTNQHLILEDNKIFCDDTIAFFLADGGLTPGNSQSIMDVLAIRNTLWSEINGAANTVIGGNGLTADITLHPASYGNNVAALNA